MRLSAEKPLRQFCRGFVWLSQFCKTWLFVIRHFFGHSNVSSQMRQTVKRQSGGLEK
jgi:hypothetical protein